ncbi:MAG: polyprenyl synthetase family protein [Chloroflexia bacterium]
MELSERFSGWLAALEAEMRACFPAPPPALLPFYGMMAYHLGWQDASFRPREGPAGKRLRPLLCLLAVEAVGGQWERALPAAAAVELVHNFSLIHDDIEDRSPLRRGRPTLWRLWGLPQALNAGDGLFTLARAALLRLREYGFPAETVLEAAALLDRAVLRLCEGQYLDLSFEGRLDVDEAAYLGMIAAKTAALLEAALELGALLGGGDAEARAALRSYGHALGLAFQVQDDILGVWGREERTGKPQAADVVERKLGLPAVYALGRAGPAGRDILEHVYGGRGAVTPEEVDAVLAVLEELGARGYAEGVAARYCEEALAALGRLPAGPARESLEEVARSLLGREA